MSDRPQLSFFYSTTTQIIIIALFFFEGIIALVNYLKILYYNWGSSLVAKMLHTEFGVSSLNPTNDVFKISIDFHPYKPNLQI